MIGKSAFNIELDEDAERQLRNEPDEDVALDLLVSAVSGTSGRRCAVADADLARVKADLAARGSSADPSHATSTRQRFLSFRRIVGPGVSGLLGLGIALGGAQIPSVVRSDVLRILLAIAILGSAVVLILAVASIQSMSGTATGGPGGGRCRHGRSR
jgi:hypothetical protein